MYMIYEDNGSCKLFLTFLVVEMLLWMFLHLLSTAKNSR